MLPCSHKVNVTFSGKIAKLFDVSLMGTNELPTVIAISSCKYCKRIDSEDIFLSNTRSTKFTINPNLEVVSSLRKR